MRLAAVLVLCSSTAYAHGPEQWIADRVLTDPITHKFCCGPSDCHVLIDGDVQEISGGWLIKEDHEVSSEFIPYERGIPLSTDGKFHRCGYGLGLSGQPGPNGNILSVFGTRCLIVPPGDS